MDRLRIIAKEQESWRSSPKLGTIKYFYSFGFVMHSRWILAHYVNEKLVYSGRGYPLSKICVKFIYQLKEAWSASPDRC